MDELAHYMEATSKCRAALKGLVDALFPEAIDRRPPDGEMLTELDPYFCQFCLATFTNATDSRDISTPDDWRGTHREDCVYAAAVAALRGK